MQASISRQGTIEKYQVIEIAGDYSLGTDFESRFNPCINEILRENKPFVALDMTKVGFFSSDSIGGVMHAVKRLKEKKGELVLFGANNTITDLLETAGVTRVIPIYKTREGVE